MGMFQVNYWKNPKYQDLNYDDPRNEETWTQEYIEYYDVIRELVNRIEKLEKQNNE